MHYDGRNAAFKQLIQLFLTLGGRVVEEKEPEYDPEMVAKVRRGREEFKKGNYKIIKTEDLWK